MFEGGGGERGVGSLLGLLGFSGLGLLNVVEEKVFDVFE